MIPPFSVDHQHYFFIKNHIFGKKYIMKLENKYQGDLIKRIKERFPGCMVLKNDPNYIQGIPDLTVFYNGCWATLEAKKSADEPHQPNQDTYVERMNNMSFSSFIYPENEKEVLDEMERSFKSFRTSRSVRSK